MSWSKSICIVHCHSITIVHGTNYRACESTKTLSPTVHATRSSNARRKAKFLFSIFHCRVIAASTSHGRRCQKVNTTVYLIWREDRDEVQTRTSPGFKAGRLLNRPGPSRPGIENIKLIILTRHNYSVN